MRNRADIISTGLAVGAWGAVAAVAALDVLDMKAFAAVLIGAAVLTLMAGGRRHAQSVICGNRATAARQTEAINLRNELLTERLIRENRVMIEAHAKILNDRVLTIERFFGLGVESDVRARMDAADSIDQMNRMNGRNTGPFPLPNMR